MKRVRDLDDTRNGWYEFTPEDAARLVQTFENRPLKHSQVERIATAMKSGRFTRTGEPVIFDHEGRLVDGQHRMTACMRVGRPFVSYVVYMPQRLGATFFDELGQVATRSASDRIALAGGSHHTTVASVVRQMHQYENNQLGINSGPTAGDIRKMWERYKDEVTACVGVVQPHWKDVRGWLGGSVLAHAYLQAARVDPVKAIEWEEGVATGANLPEGSPMLALRTLLQGQPKSQRFTIRAVQGLVVKSWLMYKHGQKVGRGNGARMLHFRTGEDVGRFDGPAVGVRRKDEEEAA